MSTTKGIWRGLVLGAAAGMLLWSAGTSRADVVADQAAALLIFPKIQVDTLSVVGPRTDTIVQVTNTSPFLVRARCYYVNANSHCSNFGAPLVPPVCRANTDCNPTGVTGGVCVPGWEEVDFQMTLTKRQPLSWRASDGLVADCPPELDPALCPDNSVPLSGGRVSGDGQSNEDTRVLPVQEDPFVGELKCIQVDPVTELPIERNDLKGEATIIATTEFGIDVSKYNAIGIQATGFQDGDPTRLNLGGPDAEYNACPNVIDVDHFFDRATIGTHNDGTRTPTLLGSVLTDLVFVPCSEDFLTQDPAFGSAVLQLLVFNEFEQRFSTHTRATCFKEIRLSDVDTSVGPADDATSIFNANVQGTLAGKTRIRAVPSATQANKVLVIAQERWLGPVGVRTTSRNVHSIQARFPTDTPLPDVIQLSPLP